MNAAGGGDVDGYPGDELTIFGDVNVTDISTLIVDTDNVLFATGATIDVAAGSILNMNTPSKWVASNISVTGGGLMRPGQFEIGSAANGDDVVWDVAEVDLDDGGLATIHADSSLTVNADSIDPDDGKFSQDLVVDDQGRLELNLSNQSAVFGAQSTITVNGNTNSDTVFLDTTNDTVVTIQGALDINGDAASNAALFIDFTSVDILDAAGRLNLRGGTQTPGETNVIAGSTINGPGTLRLASGTALRGSAGINADVNGVGNAQLIAEDGFMNVLGEIIQMGTLGAAATGTLNIDQPWQTNVANNVVLNGGTLIGATITNNGTNGIEGFGTVTAEVINDTRIDAKSGGTLVVDHPNNDWDGATDAGALNAVSGNLELRDDLGFAFGGTVRAQSGNEVFANGFALQFLPSAQMELVGGTYRSTNTTDFLGTLNASGNTPTIDVGGTFLFVSGSSATLDSALQLASPETVVESSVTFSGGGGLQNLAGNTLRLEDGANVNVLVDNSGRLAIGNSPGQATGFDYRQTATGTLEIELEGTGLTQFDRLTLTGLAELAGTLDVSLLGGFTPSLGDTFSVLTATGGVSGTFDSLELPALGAGLGWSVQYDPTLVSLNVIMATNADFNADGLLDCLDVDALVADIAAGTNTPIFDLTGDGNVDTSDLDQWLADAGAANLPSGNAYLSGDANLDGVVDGVDFIAWNDNKFTNTAAWCSGDFTADGFVDGVDFIAWNDNKFTSADAQVPVPEPTALALLALALLGLGFCRRA